MPRQKKSMNAVPVLQLDTEPAGALSVPQSTELDTAFDQCLEQAREQLRSIDEKAEFAIQVVTQSIKTQATVAKGKVLLELRQRFDQVPALEGKWLEFLEGEGIVVATANNWINSARAVIENGDEYGVDFLMNFSYGSLSKIQHLPSVVKGALLEDAKDTGVIPTVQDVISISQDPRTKLAKAMEDLETVASRKDDPTRDNRQDKQSDKRAEKSLLETIEQLKSQIAEDKIRAEMEAKDKERINAELELLKYDDEAAREQRIKRVSNSLIVSIPAVMADLQKYIAEKDHYDSKTTKSLDDSLETLINYLKPLYA